MRANYKLQRLFTQEPLRAGGTCVLDKAQSNYLANVLRKRVGDQILLFNGSDGEWRATIEEAGKRSVMVRPERLERAQPRPTDLVFAFAPLKTGRLVYMVQKAVEMGAGVIQPVFTQNTQLHRVKDDKLAAHAIEAAEQCGILSIPTIGAPVKLAALLADWDRARALIFCDEDHTTHNPLALLEPLKGRPLGVLIGPEGGFNDEERAALRALPFVTAIPLGPRILRADTAAVAAMAVIQAVAGDWTD